MGQLDGFGWISRFYDVLPIPTHPDALAARLDGVQGPVVDLGGGTARFTRRLHPGPQRPVVLDASRPMLARARRADRPVRLVQGAGQAMPLAEGSLGAITVTEAFHHFAPAQGQVLREAARVLRDDGVLLVEEIDPDRLIGRAIELGERLVGFGSVFHPPTRLASMARERFGQVSIDRTGRFTYLLEARVPTP